MKKLLSLLSVITITGTSIPTTIATSPYQKEKQTNEFVNNKNIKSNLEKLIRNKRNIEINNFNINYIEKLYAQDWTKDLLRIWISKETWKNINFLKEISSAEEFKNSLILLINGFDTPDNNIIKKENQLRILNNEDKKIIINKIIEKYNEIKIFQKKNNNALIITTTIDGKWFNDSSILSQFNNDNEINPAWGKNSEAILQVDYKFLASDKITIFLIGTEVKKYFNNFRKLTWIDFTKWLSYFIDKNVRKIDHTGLGGQIENSDIDTAKNMMKLYVFKLDDICFNKKEINTFSCNSLRIKTNREFEDPDITKNYY